MSNGKIITAKAIAGSLARKIIMDATKHISEKSTHNVAAEMTPDSDFLNVVNTVYPFFSCLSIVPLIGTSIVSGMIFPIESGPEFSDSWFV